jgi:predicted pyridoxine 5'-phosphate oxidase superfamily flavin-nucleotide-binding protein
MARVRDLGPVAHLPGAVAQRRTVPHRTEVAVGILSEDMQRVITEQRLGFVATVCPDGTPNLSPKGTTAVWDGDHLVFADIRSPQTVENLRHNAALEINVVDPFVRKGYRFKGTATLLTAGPPFDRAIAFFRERGTSHPIRTVVLMRVTRALPLVSPAYDSGLSEEEVRRRWEAHYESLHRAAVVGTSPDP